MRTTLEEREQILEMARYAQVSVSRLLRVLALAERPKSKLDQGVAKSVLDSNAELGRLGGLLKLWLTNEENSEALSKEEVRSLFIKIARTEQKLHKLVMSL